MPKIDSIKRKHAELWLENKIPLSKLREVLSSEEVKDLKFGKRWVEDLVDEIKTPNEQKLFKLQSL